ncbi:Gfa-like protein [Rubellimicrobium mesophilum DSM 19309]|uniref:Gfa-like protein n=1 Tax=Rubellimicrobium mesophilum DSM 19309 TaxID=442562 RepID=A0A017HPD4_9RHOB|nr:GFA family protein [Rubellimicrobium mesophilum]EYD76367.1 Gfa-like protein [Rubellimicrobium mesophilum DSM 19309]
MEGRCLCGAVAIRVEGEHDPRVGACHCRMCQRWSGGLFLCFTAPAASVVVTGEAREFQSSPFARRGFCPACGTHLWFRDQDEKGEPRDAGYELMPGLFDEAKDWPLRSEIYVDRAMESARLAGDHPRKTRADYEQHNPFIEGDDP